MRTLVIGDIHGASRALELLLTVIDLKPDDHLITLGDYVDRGRGSRMVLDRLIELYDGGQLIPILGNHEEMMLNSRTDRGERRMWLAHGGVQTLESYGHWPGDETYDRVPERHWRFLERECRDYHETESHFFVHG